MLIFAVIILAIALGSTLALSQQSGSTNIAGGQGDNPFSGPQPAAGTRVTEVHIRSGETIDAIQMVYASVSGTSGVAGQHGGSGGRLDTFTLDADAYITSISGRYDTFVTRSKSRPTRKLHRCVAESEAAGLSR